MIDAATRGLRRFGPAIGFVAVVLAVWEIWVRVGGVADYVLPPPSQIARALVSSRTVLVPHIWTTATESVVGLFVGSLTGVALAVVMATSETVMRMLAPLLVVTQTVPIFVLAPLLVLWFGYGVTPKIVVVALMVFFPVTISTIGGLQSAPTEQVELMRSMGAGRWGVMRYVQLPNAIPVAVDGLRISATYAVGGAVVGEWSGAERGLGVFLDRSRSAFRVDQIFAGVIVIAVLSMLLFFSVGLLGRLIAPWHFRRRVALRSTPSTLPPTTRPNSNGVTDEPSVFPFDPR